MMDERKDACMLSTRLSSVRVLFFGFGSPRLVVPFYFLPGRVLGTGFWDRASSVECVSGINQRKWVVAKALVQSPGVQIEPFP